MNELSGRAAQVHNILAARLRTEGFNVPDVPLRPGPSLAVAAVIDAVITEHQNPHLRDAQIFQLAMQWPTLAAALGQLMAENDVPVPDSFRHAAKEA